jgi:polyisoprenoid-binding protein YceI
MTIGRSMFAAGIAGLAMFAASAPALAETYAIDPDHSGAFFMVDHMGFARVVGRFRTLSGTIEFVPDRAAAGKVEITIDPNSIDTNQAKRDDHLRSPDFFNTAEFPEITFRSTAIEITGDQSGRVTGDFTMLGVTKPVTMDVVFNKMGPHPMIEGQTRAGFSARGKLIRSEFGMNFGQGGLGDEVTLVVEIEAAR